MTDPSNPDLVEQLVAETTEIIMGTFQIWWKPDFPEEFNEENGIELCRGSVAKAIREAISVTRRETLEQAAKLSVPQAEIMGTAEYREGYREGQAYIAAELRRLGENK